MGRKRGGAVNVQLTESERIIMQERNKKKARETDLRDRSRTAVREAQRMLPLLQSFARAISRRSVVVRLGENTETDGRIIWLRPPMELSEPRNHMRWLCDKRDDMGELECPGCKTNENIYMGIFHEISHVVHGSFTDINPVDIWEDALAMASKHGTPEFRDMVKNGLTQPKHKPCLELGHAIHHMVQAFCLAIEDIRVEHITSVHRPGFEEMSWWQSEVVLNKGLEQDDGNWVSWKDQPKESQIPVGVLFAAQGHDTSDRLSQETNDAIDLIEQAGLLITPSISAQTLLNAIGIVGLLNKAGIIDLDQTDEQKAGSPSAEEIMNAIEQALGHAMGELDKQLKEMEQGKKNSKQPTSDAGDGNVMKVAVEQANTFDSFSDEVEKVTVHPQLTGPGYRYRDFYTTPISDSVMAGSVMRARRIFSRSKLDKNVRNLKRGKVNSVALGSRAWGEDDRLFKRKIRAEGVDFEVVIGVDHSGSLGNGQQLHDIHNAAYGICCVLNRVNVKFSLYTHTTQMHEQVMHECKKVNQPWDTNAINALMSCTSMGSSYDGHNLEFYRKIMEKSKARKKLIIYFTDGQIPAANRMEETDILWREKKVCKDLGIGVLGIGLETDSPKDFGLDTIKVDGATDFEFMLQEVEKRIL